MITLKMPFGKYKGLNVEVLPSHYLTWLAGLSDLREPLRSAVWAEWRKRQIVAEPAKALSSDVQRMAEEIVSAGYRRLAQVHHPDHGGDGELMTCLNLAAEALRGGYGKHETTEPGPGTLAGGHAPGESKHTICE